MKFPIILLRPKNVRTTRSSSEVILALFRLENNNIGDRGAIALSKALEDNDTLLSLHLENNNISREGAYTLGEMISNKYKLSKLNLNLNPIGDEGFSRIARGI